MLFRKTSLEQGVPNRTGKGDVEDSFAVEVSDFGLAKSEFLPSERVRVQRDTIP